MYEHLNKEDYEEPCCPLKMGVNNTVSLIPIRRITEKLDNNLEKKDFSGAEKLLKYWLLEAQNGNDLRGELAILNELIGLYRKTEKKEETKTAVTSALSVIKTAELDGSITAATTYLNIATALKSFDENQKALDFYGKAKEIYEKRLKSNDYRLSGLYNNMAIALTDEKEYRKAKKMYFKALEILKEFNIYNGEAAITYCNLADLIHKSKGPENGEKEIDEYLNKAYGLLTDKNNIHDGNFAYICEKCAPTFEYYGYFAYANELNIIARNYYERT